VIRACVVLAVLALELGGRIDARPAQTPPAPGTVHWLDRPMSNWNANVTAIPIAPAITEGREALIKRCAVQLPTTPAARSIAAAGWIPQLHLDRELTQGGVEVLGGFAAADAMCRPVAFNVFVFVDGAFAGTLSPAPMSARVDGAAGPVRILSDGQLTAEFARFLPDDPLCCPSSRVTVSFRITRGRPPAVVPLEVRRTRG
jgi:hypothetical protein